MISRDLARVIGLGLWCAVALAAADERLPAPTAAKAGVVQGWAVDRGGRPLAGAVVHIYGTTMAGQNTRFEVTVGADGRYRQRVPDGIYGVRAEHVVPAGEKSFTLALHPMDGITAKSHDAEEGVAKDFVWRISGLRPGATAGEPGTHHEPGKYYGGALQVTVHQEGFATEPPLPEGATLIARLTPEGRLLDGSAAAPLEFRRTFTKDRRSSAYWYPGDIPLGRYRVAFQVEHPDATARALAVKKSLEFSAAFTESVVIDFLQSGSSGSSLPVQVTVKP